MTGSELFPDDIIVGAQMTSLEVIRTLIIRTKNVETA